MNNAEEIELRKWCLEFISKDRSFESAEDLVEAAGDALSWIKGEKDCLTVEPERAEEGDWTGFKMHHATSGEEHRLQAPDGKCVCLPVFISRRNVECSLKELWLSIYGTPNKGKSDD